MAADIEIESPNLRKIWVEHTNWGLFNVISEVWKKIDNLV